MSVYDNTADKRTENRLIADDHFPLGIDRDHNYLFANESRGLVFELGPLGELVMTLDMADKHTTVKHCDEIIEQTAWAHQFALPTSVIWRER